MLNNDIALARLQADYGDHAISREYDKCSGWAFVARRMDGGSGPLFAMSDDADRLREHLGVTGSDARGQLSPLKNFRDA